MSTNLQINDIVRTKQCLKDGDTVGKIYVNAEMLIKKPHVAAVMDITDNGIIVCSNGYMYTADMLDKI